MKNNNYKPILFKTEMVRAILAGRKTQTRRIMKQNKDVPKPLNDCEFMREEVSGKFSEISLAKFHLNARDFFGIIYIKSKYQVNDILWVRETFIESKTTDVAYNRGWGFSYKADEGYGIIKWKHSLFMPKKACRIFLKVTNVRCERLNGISESDAIAEGIEYIEYRCLGLKYYFNYLLKSFNEPFEERISAKESFQSLWDSINVKKCPWEFNPWVWVYEFERVEKPIDFL